MTKHFAMAVPVLPGKEEQSKKCQYHEDATRADTGKNVSGLLDNRGARLIQTRQRRITYQSHERRS